MLSFEETARTADLPTGPVHYNEAGQGPALFCFHGGGPGANGWDNTKHNLEFLAQRFRVFLVDLPGYGRSPPVEALEGEDSPSLYARVMGLLLDHLRLEKANLYGTSMSTMMAMQFAYDHPERVAKLVLKTPVTGPTLLTPSPPDGIIALNAFPENPTREAMARIMECFFPNPKFRTEAMIDARYASAMLARSYPKPKRAPAVSAWKGMYQVLAGLKVPVLALWGNQDRMVPMDGALMALALIPNVQVHIWGGGTGHFIEYEHPEEWQDIVTAFLLKP
ncbi:MAG: alpha/beta fold hydrolase [Hyphomonadaceae bacterium]